MVLSLEEKIKALMESKDTISEEELDTIEEGTSEAAVALKAAAHGLEAAADALSGGDSDKVDDGDDDDDDEQTATAKDTPEVKEDIDPFGKLADHGNEGESGSTKTGKLKSGLAKRNGSNGKFPTSVATDKQDDEGKTAKIKKNYQSTKQGNLDDGVSANNAEANPHNDHNNEGTTLQKGAQKNPVSEHMEALFQGEELSEEFQSKAATIFEAAVQSVAEQRIAELEEEYQQRIDEDAETIVSQLDEAVEEAKQELVDKIDGFLNTVVEEWVDDNAIALEGAMKVELVNSFIDGMKGLFKEHYFEIPDDKLDIVEEQANEINQLREALAELADEHDAIVNERVELTKAAIQEAVSDDLTDTEQEKFAKLAESIEFTSEDEYITKLETIKESYFPQGKGESVIPQDDAPVELTEEVSNAPVDPYVASIVNRIKF